jgi:hypothetical protein
MWCNDTGEIPIQVPRETIKLAQRIQRLTDVIAEENEDGNGEIVIKLRVAGGKVSRLLDFAGKWFPRKQK